MTQPSEPGHPDTESRWLLSREELEQLSPATDLLSALFDAVAAQIADNRLPKLSVSPFGLLRGQVDHVQVELPAYAVAGLVLDRLVVRSENVRIAPGLPPRLIAGPVTLRAVVSQANVDRWTKSTRVPFRVEITDDGLVTHGGIGGIRVTEITTDLDVSGRFLRLKPRKASMLGVPAPLVRFFRGYLPLPPLPRDARLERVETTEGEVTVVFVIDRFEQRLSPDLTGRLVRALARRAS